MWATRSWPRSSRWVVASSAPATWSMPAAIGSASVTPCASTTGIDSFSDRADSRASRCATAMTIASTAWSSSRSTAPRSDSAESSSRPTVETS